MVKIYKANDVINCRDDNSHKEAATAAAEKVKSCKPSEELIRIRAKKEASHIILQAVSEAEGITEKARKEARIIIDQAAEAADRLIEEARINGYNQGLAECEESVNEKIQEAERTAEEIITNAYKERENILSGLRDEILELALSISEKILNIELDRNDESFKSLVLNAVSKLADSSNVKVRVSEDDYEKYFSNDKGEAFAQENNLNITFIKDRLLKRGDCVVDSDSGTVDASADMQMEKIKLAFGVNM